MEQESLSNNNRYNNRIPKKSSASNSSKIIQIVKLNTSILVFLKRILRLYQITSNFPSMTTGSTFISTYRMIDNYSPLLTIFQMVKYPNYTINIRLKSSLSEPTEGKSLLFKSRKQFHQWEATTELRVLFEEVKNKHTVFVLIFCLKHSLFFLSWRFMNKRRGKYPGNKFKTLKKGFFWWWKCSMFLLREKSLEKNQQLHNYYFRFPRLFL
jgi:hypothetical protein